MIALLDNELHTVFHRPVISLCAVKGTSQRLLECLHVSCSARFQDESVLAQLYLSNRVRPRANCTSWNLLLNENKCSIVHFRTNNNSKFLQYNLNGKIFSSKAKVKDLGLTFSTDLNWQHDYKMQGLLHRTFSSHVSVSAKRCLYVSLVRK